MMISHSLLLFILAFASIGFAKAGYKKHQIYRHCSGSRTTFSNAKTLDDCAKVCCEQEGKPRFDFKRSGSVDMCACCTSEFVDDVFTTKYDTFQCTADAPPASSYGDPHFATWNNGTKYDFHGECDLVLISNPHFADGLGLEVQGRTKIETSWSRIEAAAIKLGDHVLEIAAGEKQIRYWLDGEEVADMETGDAALGDHAIRFKRINGHQSQTRLDLGHGNAVSVETFKKFVRVNTKVVAADKFDGSVGMLGSHPDGKLVGRDKTTVFENTDEFGMEWQVRATDPQLFHTAGPVQFPIQCAMPDQTKRSQARRRLGEAAVSEEEAALACARVSEAEKDACIFDVLATNDKDMAGSY